MIPRFEQSNKYYKLAIIFVAIFILLLTSYASQKYSGNISVFLLFTVTANFLLYLGFSKNAIFFDTFIGVLFWLGFWLKLTIRVTFFDGFFHEPIGSFDRSDIAFDQSLLVATCGMLGLIFVSLIRRKLFFNYPNNIENISHINLFYIYKRYRKYILFLFLFLFLFISISNFALGIYQRGIITQTKLPFGLSGLYKWLLLFGLASFSALFLNFEFKVNKKQPFVMFFLSLLESFFSNVSMLSRGMVLNSSALLFGALVSFRINAIKIRLNSVVVVLLTFSIMFFSSSLLVNYFRVNLYENSENSSTWNRIIERTAPLFIDRWVGMEGVMAVSSHPNLSWNLLNTALKESYNEREASFYDNTFIRSPYFDIDKTKHHFISLPGIVAFFFYSGSFWFLFVSMFVLGGFAALIEFSVYKLGGQNLILTALFSQILAYRFTSFGYVPAQSYLLLGALFFNLLLIYFAEKFFAFFRNRYHL
jgi:hypothetical protein